MGMVERVARAVCAAHDGNDPDQPTTGLPDVPDVPLWHDYRNFAIAALEAMREPTEEMIDAGVEAKMKLYERLEAEGKNTRIIVVANHPAGTIYEAMIDKAIQESGE